MLTVECNNEQIAHKIDQRQLLAAARQVLKSAGIKRGEISLAVVSDERMHALNRQYLNHDYPTDVLSFVLEEDSGYLDGEVIVSADYAAREAARLGWSTNDELTLYVVHGMLHLVGYDDTTDDAKQQMRAAERTQLAALGLTPRYDEE
jgi:probable rRNA maturation factor